MTARRDLKPATRDHARILSASAIGAAALALVGSVAYFQMKQGEAPTPYTLENPAPPPDLARAEAARAAAEKRLAEAMAIQVPALPDGAAAAPKERVAHLEKPEEAPEPVAAPPPPPVAPTPSVGMSAAEQEALLNRVSGLLRQGDVGAARAVLNRLVRENNAKAAYMLAQSYDPVVLRQGRVVGMRADPELARSLYEQALRGGVTEARVALDLLARAD